VSEKKEIFLFDIQDSLFDIFLPAINFGCWLHARAKIPIGKYQDHGGYERQT
jgi:hypothetical protein